VEVEAEAEEDGLRLDNDERLLDWECDEEVSRSRADWD
jgi:hypothetical protein